MKYNAELERWVKASLISPEQRDKILAHERGSSPTRLPWAAIFGESLSYLGGLAMLGGAIVLFGDWFDKTDPLNITGFFGLLTLLVFMSGRALQGRDKAVLQRLGGVLLILFPLFLFGALAALVQGIFGENASFKGIFGENASFQGIFGPQWACLLAGASGLLLSLRGLRKDGSLSHHFKGATLLLSVVFLEFGFYYLECWMWQDDDFAMLSLLCGAGLLFYLNRRESHGLLTCALTLHFVLALPIAWVESNLTSGNWLEESSRYVTLFFCLSWLYISSRFSLVPRRLTVGIGSLFTVFWCFLIMLERTDGLIMGLIVSTLFLYLAVRNQDVVLFVSGGLIALLSGPILVEEVFAPEHVGFAFILSGLALVGVGVGLTSLWGHLKKDQGSGEVSSAL